MLHKIKSWLPFLHEASHSLQDVLNKIGMDDPDSSKWIADGQLADELKAMQRRIDDVYPLAIAYHAAAQMRQRVTEEHTPSIPYENTDGSGQNPEE